MKKIVSLYFVLFIATALFSQKRHPEQLLTKEFLGAERRVIVSRNMKLSLIDLKKFWPIYDNFEKEREVLVNKKLAIERKYINDTKTMSNIELDLIHNQSFSLDKKITELREETYQKIKESIGTAPATQFLQIDAQISNYISFELQKSIPLEGVISKEEREKLETVDSTIQQ